MPTVGDLQNLYHDGFFVTILPATTLVSASPTAVNYDVVHGLGAYSHMTLTMTVSAKDMVAPAAAANVFLQDSPDQGTTWDDLARFTAITSSLVSNGVYVMHINRDLQVNAVDRVTTLNAIAVASIRLGATWADRIRASTTLVTMGTGTVTVTVNGYFQR